MTVAQLQRTVILACVVVAASFVLSWYDRLLTGPTPQPAKMERMEPTPGTPSASSPTLPGSQTSPQPAKMERKLTPGTPSASSPTPPGSQTSPQSTETPGNNVSGKELSRIISSTSSWEHVAHTAISLSSCVAVFAILAWTAVALNKEED
jgi:hypothetical protein